MWALRCGASTADSTQPLPVSAARVDTLDILANNMANSGATGFQGPNGAFLPSFSQSMDVEPWSAMNLVCTDRESGRVAAGSVARDRGPGGRDADVAFANPCG
jgi:hypothetical protein